MTQAWREQAFEAYARGHNAAAARAVEAGGTAGSGASAAPQLLAISQGQTAHALALLEPAAPAEEARPAPAIPGAPEAGSSAPAMTPPPASVSPTPVPVVIGAGSSASTLGAVSDNATAKGIKNRSRVI